MKSKDIFWGVLLVGIGLMFLLRNFDVITFDWHVFRSLWPVLIIILGVALLPVSSFVRVILAMIIVAGSIIFVSVQKPESNHFFRFQDKFSWDWEDETDEDSWNQQVLTEGLNPDLSHAVLEMDAAAGKFGMESTDEYLFKFENSGNLGKYNLVSEEAGNSAILRLKMEERKFTKVNKSNNATIYLNTEPIWDISMDAGAASINFNLQDFKVDKIDIDGGAADINLKLGDRNENTNVRINTGAASVFVEVPQSSGCEIYTSTVLSSRTFEGFQYEGDNFYRTENFDDASKKITLRIDAAVSSLKVIRY